MTRHTVAIGTDMASWCIADQANRPSLKGATQPRQLLSEIEAAAAEGNIVYVETGMDGSWVIQLLLEEPLPAQLAPLVSQAVRERSLVLSSGQLWIAGTEAFLFDNAPESGLGASVNVQSGLYRVTVYEVEDTGASVRRLVESECGSEALVSLQVSTRRLRHSIVATLVVGPFMVMHSV